MKTCTNCGAGNADAAKFCNECGTSLAPAGQRPLGQGEGAGGGRAGGVVDDQTRRTVFDETLGADPAGGQPPAFQEGPRSPGQFQSSSGQFQSSSEQSQASAQEPQSAATILSTRPGPLGLDDLRRLQEKRRADIVFALDCTSSMRGEIEAIKDAILMFVDSIKTSGVRVRVGLIEFRDRLIDEEHRALDFDGEPFTADPAAFRREVSKLRASGGGDEPESSLDALMLALRQPFDPAANKVIVLVTDAPPHVPDREAGSVEEVARAVRDAGVRQLYLVIRTQDAKSQAYLKLLEGTRGMAFELGRGDDFRSRAADFQRTLMSLGKTISSATR